MSDLERYLVPVLLLLAAGAGSGFAGGLFGVGGGIIRVPIFLVLLPRLGVDESVLMHVSAGTSLALGVPTGVRSALRHRATGNLDTRFLRSWIPPLAVGVVAGLIVMRVLPTHVLVLVFGCAMLVIAAQMIALPKRFVLTHEVPGRTVRAAIAGAIGGLSVLIGISGGAFTTPTLTLLGMPIKRATAISAVGVATVATIGTVGSIVNGLGVDGRPASAIGYVDVIPVAIMLPTILIFAPLGVRVANGLPERVLRISFGVMLVGVGASMIWRAVG